MALRIIGWGLALAVAIGAGAYYFTHEPPLAVSAVRVERGHVEQTVAAISSGTVSAVTDSMIASGWTGIVTETPAQEGARVTAGSPLILLEQTELDAHVRLAEANLAAGQSQLEKAKIAAEIYQDIARTSVSVATERAKSAAQDFERIRKLGDAVSQSELDKYSLQNRIAEQELAAAEASQRENLVREQEILTAESNVAQLAAALAVAEATRDKATIRAPFDGIVADLYVDVGESVMIGMPLVQLVRTDEILVEAPFDEANAAEIQLGQRARINLDAYRDTDFEGEVIYIAPVVTTNSDLSRTLNVKIRVTGETEKFMAGMSADVTIIVQEKDDVIYAPSDAIIREALAYVVEDGTAVQREVTPGVGNWERREIVGGLAEGDLLITSVSLDALEDGVAVRVTEEEDNGG